MAKKEELSVQKELQPHPANKICTFSTYIRSLDTKYFLVISQILHYFFSRNP